jgi:hypothetical protein
VRVSSRIRSNDRARAPCNTTIHNHTCNRLRENHDETLTDRPSRQPHRIPAMSLPVVETRHTGAPHHTCTRRTRVPRSVLRCSKDDCVSSERD